jgi:hypothetical protein
VSASPKENKSLTRQKGSFCGGVANLFFDRNDSIHSLLILRILLIKTPAKQEEWLHIIPTIGSYLKHPRSF